MFITRSDRYGTTTIEVHPLRDLIFCLLMISAGGLFFYWATFSKHPGALLIVGGGAILFGAAGIRRTLQLMGQAARTYRG